MNCKGCNYPLWNLPDRRCPECGKEFYPSLYEFVPRAVRFLCPFCRQQYFGTDEHGHLVPRTFACVSCNNRINMDEMILLPAEGVEAKLTVQEVNPWLDAHGRGPFSRWFATVGRSMTAPTRLIHSTPTESATGRAFLFALVNIALTFVTAGAASAAFFLLVPVGPGGFAAFGMFGLMLGAVFAIPIVWLLLWSLTTHGLLRLTGPLPGGLRITCRCMWYSSGPYVISAVPCIGSYLFSLPAVIWWGVSATMMLTKAHAINGLRATVATFAPILLILTAVVALIILPMFSGISTTMTYAGGVGGSPQSVLQQSRASSMSMALLNFRSINSAYPTHAAELIGNGPATAMDFSLSMDPLAPDAIPVGGTSLSQFELAQPATRQRTVSQLQSAMPKDVIAHRVGDYVFTYHQLPVPSPDPGLWVFVAEEPAAVTPPPASSGGSPAAAGPSGFPSTQPVFIVGFTDGRTQPFAKFTMPQALQVQNSLRAMYNLPPLPDPTTVTTNKPAVAPK